jgi:hypothetical protein
MAHDGANGLRHHQKTPKGKSMAQERCAIACF